MPNMRLITVSSPDRSDKVFVVAQTLCELREAALEKLRLPPGNYEFSRASDGVKILSDDVLQFLSDAAERDGNLAVVISATTASNPEERTLCTPPPPPVAPLSVQRNNVVHPPLSMRSIVATLDPILEIVLHPEDTTITPGRFLQQKKAAVREVYQELVRFIRNRVKSYSYATASHYAELLFKYDGGKYSKLFEVKVGSKVKSGLSTFTLQVYNHLNYRKDSSEKRARPRGARRRLEMLEENVDDPAPADKASAAYGCVAYEVALPAGETEESQEDSRLKLMDLDADSNEAAVLMERTYATLRVRINHAFPLRTCLPPLFQQWPLLKQQQFLIAHASHLLGKDVTTVWSSNLGAKCGRFTDFMLTHWSAEDKRKSSVLSRRMLDILEEKSAASDRLGPNLSNCLSVFPLLVGFLKEQLNLLYQVMPATTSDAEVLNAVANDNPILIIRGDSLFDDHARADLLMVNRVMCPADTTLDGLLLLILAYFIFGFKYPSKIANSLEFIQRQFLDVNPDTGSRREGPGKVSGLSAKVRNLTELLTFHCSTWNVCRF